MKPIVNPIFKALTIDLDARDINGNEFVTIELMQKILSIHDGYVDSDNRKLVVYKKK